MRGIGRAAFVTMDLLGVKLIGLDATTGKKVLLTLLFSAAIVGVRYAIVSFVWLLAHRRKNETAVFWTRQMTGVVAAVLIILATMSIWIDDGRNTATGLGLVTAGLAVALQKVWTSLGGYVVILRGKTFTVGDRITMGGVRGDVISLGFLQTRIMEMGQPPEMSHGGNTSWVAARQYTGRIVSVTNDKVFDEPVYNLSRELPFLFEEIRVPVKYGADRKRAEEILVEAAEPATASIRELGEERMNELAREYSIPPGEMTPRVYYRLTDNWIELTLRFMAPHHGIRSIKDQIARGILERFEREGLSIASTTVEITAFPEGRVASDGAGPARHELREASAPLSRH